MDSFMDTINSTNNYDDDSISLTSTAFNRTKMLLNEMTSQSMSIPSKPVARNLKKSLKKSFYPQSNSSFISQRNSKWNLHRIQDQNQRVSRQRY